MSNPASSKPSQQRKPALFEIDDTTITVTDQQKETTNNLTNSDLNTPISTPPTIIPDQASTSLFSKLFSVGFLLTSSIMGIIVLWLTSKLVTSFEQILERGDILGWSFFILLIIALTSILIMITREIIGILGIRKLKNLRTTARQAYNENKIKPARHYLNEVKSLYETTPERAWMLDRIKTLDNEIMDGQEIIELVDKELGTSLDKQAKIIIAAHARQISLITAIAPGPFIDMAAVAILNLRMIRKITQTYGVRPGFWGQMRLSRNVLAHLALSGGISMTSDLLQPLIGTSIASKLSKKLGEGLFNGALTIRIGLSAIEITRPIPYVATKPPSFRKLVTSALTPSEKSSTAKK